MLPLNDFNLSCGTLSSEREHFLKSCDGSADVFRDNGAIKAKFPVDDNIIYCNFSHVEFFLVIVLQVIAASAFLCICICCITSFSG